MKVIINSCYGGFSVKQDIANSLGFDSPYDHSLRFNSDLIAMIENGINCNGNCAKLEVVEIPPTATDYEILEYDGMEDIIVVIDGQIRHIY